MDGTGHADSPGQKQDSLVSHSDQTGDSSNLIELNSPQAGNSAGKPSLNDGDGSFGPPDEYDVTSDGLQSLGLGPAPDSLSNPSSAQQRDVSSPPTSEEDERFCSRRPSTPSQICFCPTPALMTALQGMGFTEVQAKAGLYNTGNASTEAAVDWILNHTEEECTLPEDIFASNMKMVLVVNAELKMGLGKMAAQVSHASLGLYREMIGNQDRAMELGVWDEQGETMVVVKGDSARQLLELERLAQNEELRTYTVQDAGRTQIAAGSLTVLAVFGPEDTVDKVTGKLKLL